MSIKSIVGFTGLAHPRDEITVLSGTLAYGTSPAFMPNGNTTNYVNFNNIGGGTFQRDWKASASEFWLHFHFQPRSNTTANDNQRFGWANNGNEMGAISMTDTGSQAPSLRLRLLIDGVWVATSTFQLTIFIWESIHVHVTGQGGGQTVTVYVNGDLATPVITWVGDTDPNAYGSANQFIVVTTRNNDRFANFIAMDPSDATGITDPADIINPGIVALVPDADGFYTDWTGTYTSIDERPANDADFIEATAVGQRSTFSHAPPGSAVARIMAVQWYGRVTRTGTTAGANLTVTRRDTDTGTDYDESAVPAPGDGDVSHLWDQHPAGGNWTPSTLNSTEFGALSVT